MATEVFAPTQDGIGSLGANDRYWGSVYAEQFELKNAQGISHNAIFRGKNLGIIASKNDLTQFLSEHEVSTGVFKDLYVGDYFTLMDGTYNKEWVIAGFDTELHTYLIHDNTHTTTHHISIIPRSGLFEAVMNDTDTTVGGYVGSKMYKETLPSVLNNLRVILGDRIVKRGCLLSTQMTSTIQSNGYAGWSGASSNQAWSEEYITLLSEPQVCGTTVWSSSGYDVGEAHQQLPLFAMRKFNADALYTFWLRAVANSTHFCRAHQYGYSYYNPASGAGISVVTLVCIG